MDDAGESTPSEDPTRGSDSAREARPVDAAHWPAPPPGAFANGSPMPPGTFAPRPTLDVGDVLSTCGRLVAENGLRDLGFLAVFVVIGPMVALAPVGAAAGFAFRQGFDPSRFGEEGIPAALLAVFGLLAVSIAVTAVLAAIASAGLTFGALEWFEGRRATFGAMAARGLGRMLPVSAATFVTTVVTAVGLVLGVAPGIFAATCFALTTPIVIHRGSGVVEAIAESYRLSEGHRLEIFLVGLAGASVMFLGSLGLCCVASAVLVPLSAAEVLLEGSGGSLLPSALGFGFSLLLNLGWVALVQMGFAYAPAVIYARLASLGRAAFAPEIARVFG